MSFLKKVEWKDVKGIRGHSVGKIEENRKWRTIYLYVFSAVVFAILSIAMVNLQIVHGHEYSRQSEYNRLEEHVIQADRGIIYDRNGNKLAVNVPSFNVVLDPREMSEDDADQYWTYLEGILGISADDLSAKYEEAMDFDPMTKKIVLAQDVTRDQILEIRAESDSLKGVWVDYASKRKYTGGSVFSHILGYTGEADEDLVESDEDVDMGDIVGREGIEYSYDERFRGTKGVRVIEIDAMQNVVAEYVNQGSAPIPGDSLYLSVDMEAQKKLYEILEAGVDEYDAMGAAAVIENVHTGEILAAVNVPTYDNNLFIGGISQKDYDQLYNDPDLPLFNRFIAAQEAPGSMYKTLVAAAALQDGAITRNTVINSVGMMYWPDGTPRCPEYHGHVYGPLNLVGGISKSSNNYFCETMQELGIDNFVPYAEFYGFGSPTGVDIPGEMSGRVPSPEAKAALAESSPWLDGTWYPGDSDNSGIGQGIVAVTPMQMVNWASTVANGGKVLQPRFAYKWESGGGESEEGYGEVEPVVLREGKVDADHLATVREGMRGSVYGSQRIIIPLSDAKVPVAAKTGTAEFGVKDEKGEYTRTHAWVMGFWPYEDPQYSFVVFLQGGGASNNAAQLAREFIDWQNF